VERVPLILGHRIERDMRSGGRRGTNGDREVVEPLTAEVRPVVLGVELLDVQRLKTGTLEPAARLQVAHDEQDVVDDDQSLGHGSNSARGPSW
jgi:hypothetical protein